LQIPAIQIKLRITTVRFIVPEKPLEQDPFKPAEPNIPGVTGNPARNQPAPEPSQPSTPRFRNSAAAPDKSPAKKVLAIAAIVIFVGSVALFSWKRSNAPEHTPVAPAVAAAPAVDLPPVVAQPSANVPEGPGPVATTAELATAWSSKRFVFRATQASENIPALVVHVPSGVYWGLSLREPYGTCQLEYVTDLGKLEREYGFHADHPMVADPCRRVLFDLARYGTGPNGEVRGAIVSGRGVRPPIAIEVKARGKQVVAIQLEH
jgi:hypothetical protein